MKEKDAEEIEAEDEDAGDNFNFGSRTTGSYQTPINGRTRSAEKTFFEALKFFINQQLS